MLLFRVYAALPYESMIVSGRCKAAAPSTSPPRCDSEAVASGIGRPVQTFRALRALRGSDWCQLPGNRAPDKMPPLAATLMKPEKGSEARPPTLPGGNAPGLSTKLSTECLGIDAQCPQCPTKAQARRGPPRGPGGRGGSATAVEQTIAMKIFRGESRRAAACGRIPCPAAAEGGGGNSFARASAA